MATDTEVHTEDFYDPTEEDIGRYLYASYLHIGGVGVTGNAVMRIVNDGSSDAIQTNGSLGTVPTVGASDFDVDDFIVLEPVEQYPGGGRWQVLLVKTAAANLRALLAPDGGWSSTTYGAPASGNNYGFGSGVNPDPVITDLVLLTTLADLPDEGSLRISSCNKDVYNGSDFYTYFRILVKNPGNSLFGAGEIRVGGYIPPDPLNDTKPVCMLARNAQLGTSSHYWGTSSTSPTANWNRTPLEYGHTTQLNAAGLCALLDADFLNVGTDRTNQVIGQSPILVSYDDNRFIGLFGQYDMRCVDNALPNLGTDGFPQTYFNSNELMFRWNP